MESSYSPNSPPRSPENSNDRLSLPEVNAQAVESPHDSDDDSSKEEACISSNNPRADPRLQGLVVQQPAIPYLLASHGIENATQFDRLIQLLNEADAAYRVRRFSPYPVHQQLFYQQHNEQERRRQSLSAASSSRLSPRSSYQEYRFRYSRLALPDNTISNYRVASEIDKLTTRRTSTDQDCTENCVICMSYFDREQELRELRCSHKYHMQCIDQWLFKSCLCPICRADLSRIASTPPNMWEEYAPVANEELGIMLDAPAPAPVEEVDPLSVPSPALEDEAVTKE